MMNDAYLVSAVRTPIGKFLGGLADLAAPELGGRVLKEVLARSNIPAGSVDEVIMGNVLQAGVGQNPARQAALKALTSVPDQLPRAGCTTMSCGLLTTARYSSSLRICSGMFSGVGTGWSRSGSQ